MNILKLEKYTSLIFKLGDRVQLNSGGPEMTVFSINKAKNSILCAWWDSNTGTLHDAEFNPACLQFYK